MLQKRGLSKKAVYLLVLLSVEFIGLWAIMSINAQALESGYAELKNRPQIDTTGSQIGSEYAFSPTISAQTQISLVTKNTTNCKNTELKDTGDHVFQFQPQDSSKATKIQVLYTNVGFSNTGKVLDARVDVEVNGVVSFTVSQIGHVKTDTTSSSKASAMQAKVSITFLDHAQSTPTLVSGHLTFGNINSLKILNVRLGMFNKIYCKDNCELWYQDLDDTTNITSQSNEHPKDKRDSFTGTFENQSTVAYSFTGTTYKEIDSGFDLGSVTDVAIPKINKSGSEEKAPADKSGLVVYKKRLLYTIQQNLPSKSAGYLSSYKIEDTISKYWQVSEIKVTDEANTDQTKNFDYTIAQADAGSKLQITAKTSALNNVDFYGHFYNFNIYGSFAQDDKGQLISSITEQFNSTNNSGFLGQPNQAKVTYRVNNTANDVTNETKENGAVNKIALQGPQLSKLQCVNGEKNKVAGIVQDPACDKAGEAVPLTFWINYTNTAGKVIQNKPLLINGSNTLSNTDPGQQINFTADLPTDIQSTGSSYQGVTIIVKDKYGLQKQIPLTVNYWWGLSTDDQDQIELDIYDHTASSGFASKKDWPWDAERSTINRVDFKGKLAVQGALNGMFYQMTNLKQITNLKNLDTSNVTSMDSLFRQTALTSLDLGTTFDTSQVTNMSAMFDSCKKLTSLKGLNNFQTQNVTDMSYMFRHSGLTTLDLTNFDTAKVTNMTSMFQSMNNLTQLNISSFRMDKINKTPTSSNYPDQYGTVRMFAGDSQLSQLTLGPNNRFPDDPKLDNAKPVDENEEGPHTTKWQAVAGGTVDNPQGTPLTAQQLIALYQDQGKPVQETYVWDHTWWQFDSTNGTLILYPRSNLVFNSSGKQAPKWPWDKTNWKNSQVKTVILKGPIKIQGSLQSMFAHMHNLSKIDHLDYLDTSSVNNMRAMFWDTGLKTLDISSFDMLQVQDTAAMFLKTPNLYKITIGKKAQFVHQHNDDSVFSLPGHSNFYIEGKQYSNTSDNWQEIDETDPNSFQIIGLPKSVAELNNYKSNDDKSHTFIWEPVETGTLSIAQVPQNLQYQVINLQPFLQQLLTSSSNSSKQEITVKDNRSLRTQRQKDAGWTAIKIKTSGTLSNDTSTISYFLKLQDTANPKTTGRELILAKPSFKKIDTTEATNYTWQPAASDPGIQLQLNLKTPPVNLLGQYTGKLTYELDNSVQ